jgi:hypothetical protein
MSRTWCRALAGAGLSRKPALVVVVTQILLKVFVSAVLTYPRKQFLLHIELGPTVPYVYSVILSYSWSLSLGSVSFSDCFFLFKDDL